MKEKVVIIGAGPVGCYLGRPLHCTGIVGKVIFDHINLLSISHHSIINTINGATIHFNGDSFDIERESAAYILERDKFDK